VTIARVLVVEDDRGIATMLERGLRLAGHEVVTSPTMAAGRSTWESGAFELVILDVMLPDGDGIDLLAERRAEGDETPALLLTAREEADLRERADRAGASAYLPKPFAYADLLTTVERLIRR
jgi:DNA-binding response OmpR family regulator